MMFGKRIGQSFQFVEQGQVLVEFAFVLPLLLIITLGIIEWSYALFDQHVVVKLAREGSNLISRNTTLTDAGEAMKQMGTAPVNISTTSTTSRLVFSVIQTKSTTPNKYYPVLYKKYAIGSSSWSSAYSTTGTCSFTGTDYENSITDGCLIFNGSYKYDSSSGQYIAVLPDGVELQAGNQIFVTEVYNRHISISPTGYFGVNVPSTLYGRAIF